MYRRVTELAPRLELGHMNLGLALAQVGRFDEAEGRLLEAVRLRPNPRLLMNLGALYYLQERFEQAVEFFERSIAMGATDPMQYRDLGDGYRQLRRKKQAMEAYRRGRDIAEEEVSRNPREAFARVQLGLICAELGDSRRAEFELSQALSLGPGNAAVVREAAIAYEALGRRDKAAEILRGAPARTLQELSRHPDMKGMQAVIQEMISKNPE
jgi:Flp pilus assembly protein TadD